MRKFVLSIILLASQSLIFSQVSAQLSIMTVDVGTLYEGYYKTKEATEKLQGRFDTAKAQLDEMIASGDCLVPCTRCFVEVARRRLVGLLKLNAIQCAKFERQLSVGDKCLLSRANYVWFRSSYTFRIVD